MELSFQTPLDSIVQQTFAKNLLRIVLALEVLAIEILNEKHTSRERYKSAVGNTEERNELCLGEAGKAAQGR